MKDEISFFQMKIKYKLQISFVLIALLFAALGVIEHRYIHQVTDTFTDLEVQTVPSLTALLEVSTAARRASIKAVEYSMRGKTKDLAKTLESLEQLEQQLKSYLFISNQSVDSEQVKLLVKYKNDFSKVIHDYLSIATGPAVKWVFEEEEKLQLSRRNLVQTIDSMLEQVPDLHKFNLLLIKSEARKASIKLIEFILRGKPSDKAKAQQAVDTLVMAQQKYMAQGLDYPELSLALSSAIDDYLQIANEFLYLMSSRNNSVDDIYRQEEAIHQARKLLIGELYLLTDLQYSRLHQVTSNTSSQLIEAAHLQQISSVVLIAIAALVGYLLSRTILTPLDKLNIAAKQIGEGKLEADVDINSNDEMSELAGNINQMADAVAQRTQQLAESESKHRTLINTLPDLVWLKDADGLYLSCNRRFERFFGATEDEIKGKTDYDFVDKEQADFFREKDRAAMLAAVSTVNEEEVVYADDGHKELLETIKTPLYDDKGNLLGVLGIARDITDRKKAVEDLQNSEKRYRQLVEDIPDILYSTDMEGAITFISPSAQKVSGYTQEEAIGLKMAETMYANPDEREVFLQEIRANGFIENFEAKLKRKDGSIWWGSANAHLLTGEDGSFQGVEGIVRDISEKKQGELALAEANKNLEQQVAERTSKLVQANQAKSEFLANMSHEIRTPLNGALGMAKIGLRETQEAGSRKRFSHILDSGQHLLGVINDILDFSRIEARKLIIESQSFQLMALVEEAVSMLAERAEDKGLGLSIKFGDALPVWVNSDPLRLQQILLNLLSNAIKFTSKGQVLITVSADGDMICFKVSDSGIGMNEEQISRLFSPFEQADSSTTREYGGTGLGLAISYNLAQLMGGEISVESQLNEGSIFSLNLPLPETKPPVSIDLVSQETSGGQLTGLHILVAEDVEINRLIIEDMLEHEGATIVFAEDGKQAIDHLEETGVDKIDIILMDVQMPVMDGYEATMRIHEMAPDLPVIGVTAHALKDEHDKCLAAGMVDHVTKPIEAGALISAIRHHV